MDCLALATQTLLHPSVMCHMQLRSLAALISKTWIESGGYMEINVLYEIFQTRLEEYAIAIRAKVAGEIELIPHLCTLGQRSGPMMNQAKATASIRYLSMSAMVNHKKGLKETIVGAAQKEPLSRNSEGDLRKYERAGRAAGIPWEEDKDIRPRNAETQSLQYMNCFEWGHKARDPKTGKQCTKVPARIPAGLTAWQRELALKIRREYNERKQEEKERKDAVAAKKKAEKEKEKAITAD